MFVINSFSFAKVRVILHNSSYFSEVVAFPLYCNQLLKMTYYEVVIAHEWFLSPVGKYNCSQ
jgi:hypothetical protein